jgi:N-acetylgalactosamine kinase
MKNLRKLLDSLLSPSLETAGVLSRLYGDESVDYQRQRYAALIKSFIELYPDSSDSSQSVIVRAPGRVNLIGEHTDYNGLPVMPMAINRDILVLGSVRPDAQVRLSNMDSCFEERHYEVGPEISPFAKGDWGNYSKAGVQTVFDYLYSQNVPPKRGIQGMNALLSADLPASGGLSSSSALVVANALAFLYLNQLELEKAKLADLLAKGERYVGTEGGGMDQAASLLGQKGSALKIDFFPLRVRSVPLPREFRIIVINSLIKADKTQATMENYNRRPRECRLIVALFNAALRQLYGAEYGIARLADHQSLDLSSRQKQAAVDLALAESPFELWQISQKLKKSVAEIEAEFLKLKDGRLLSQPPGGFPLRRRYRHVISEAERVEAAALAFERGDIAEVGRLMYESHRSCAEDFEISCPELDQLVKIAREAGAVGARLTGAGFGGCIVALVEDSRVPAFVEAVRTKYFLDYMKVSHPEITISSHDSANLILDCSATEGAGLVFA